MMNTIIEIVRGQLVFGVPVLESVVGDDGPQVVRVPADDPRASLRIVFTLDTTMHVQHRQ